MGLIHFSSLMNLTLRQAVSADIPALRVLIDASVRGLQTADYTPAQIEGALQTIYGVDSQLIADGTYYIVEEISETALIVGCGGWSKRKTLFGGDRWTRREDSLLNPQQDAAKIRAFFVHPDWVRRGIGRMILETCEKAAAAAGFTRFEMGATLTGVPLYRASGYVQIERLDVPLKNGESLAVIRMEKRMGSPK
ncbi:MAG TPA: GNAT family N-acetyltransferase [Terriglobales bacterium]|nr:GNAT family N-acetyltransferase [Terriglobales bacterium]